MSLEGSAGENDESGRFPNLGDRRQIVDHDPHPIEFFYTPILVILNIPSSYLEIGVEIMIHTSRMPESASSDAEIRAF
jgi:hypothetical protein